MQLKLKGGSMRAKIELLTAIALIGSVFAIIAWGIAMAIALFWFL